MKTGLGASTVILPILGFMLACGEKSGIGTNKAVMQQDGDQKQVEPTKDQPEDNDSKKDSSKQDSSKQDSSKQDNPRKNQPVRVDIPRGFIDLGSAAASCLDEPHMRRVDVASSEELTKALEKAAEGDLIHMAEGIYADHFVISKAASDKGRITLCGTSKAILDGGNPKKGYGLHLNKATYWRLIGFTIRNAQKGLMSDESSYNLIDGLTVHITGDEAVHFRANSHHNTIQRSFIDDTGHKKYDYAEGVYIGSSKNNMKNDRSDYNMVLNNHFGSKIRSEHIDAKEYSSFGLIEGNTFDGSGVSGVHFGVSVIFIKGNDYIVRANTITNTFKGEEGSAIRVNVVEDGYANRNLFEKNIIDLNAPGYGINIVKGEGNIVKCDNKVKNAKALSNVTCTP